MNLLPRSLVVVSLLLGSCVSLESGKEKLASAKSCCASTAEFQYEPLAPNEDIDAAIGEGSPVFDFPEGRSFFRAFRFSEVAAVPRIRVKLFAGLDQGWSTATHLIVCPSISFLSQNHRVIETRYQPPTWHRASAFTGEYFSVEHDVPAGSRFVVIHSSSSRAGEKVAKPGWGRTHNMAFGVIGMLLVESGPKLDTATCAPTGRLSVEARSQ